MKNLMEELEDLNEMLQMNISVDFECDNVPAKEFEYLSGILQEIVKNPERKMREYLRQKGFFVQNMWSSQDVIGTGKNMGKEITEEQAIDIMELMGRRFDANYGVTWDFIEAIIEEYFKKI